MHVANLKGMHARANYNHDHACMQYSYSYEIFITSIKPYSKYSSMQTFTISSVQNACLRYEKVLVTCKESSPLQILFSKISKSPHNSKTAIKSISKVFEINIKIIQRIFKE